MCLIKKASVYFLYLHNLITVQPPHSTRSSSLVTLARPSTPPSLRITVIVPSCMLPVISGINSRLPSVNHALISPVLTHPVLWVALPPSVSLPHHSRHPTPHSFIPLLKPSFYATSSHRSLPFLFMTDSTDFPDCLAILLSISVFYFLVFLFPTF